MWITRSFGEMPEFSRLKLEVGQLFRDRGSTVVLEVIGNQVFCLLWLLEQQFHLASACEAWHKGEGYHGHPSQYQRLISHCCQRNCYRPRFCPPVSESPYRLHRCRPYPCLRRGYEGSKNTLVVLIYSFYVSHDKNVSGRTLPWIPF